MFLAPALLAAVFGNAPSLSIEVSPESGLTVSAAGIPVVRGSYFQYYEPGWSKGYYSSLETRSRVERINTETYRLTYDDPAGEATGSETFRLIADRLHVHCEFGWRGEHPVKVEAAIGLLWAPAFDGGSLKADGNPTRALNTSTYPGQDIVARRYGPDASSYSFTFPLGQVDERSSRPLTLFDARGGYPQPWAAGRRLWWLGDLGLVVQPKTTTALDADWTFQLSLPPPSTPLTAKLSSRSSAAAFLPDTSMPVLIPKPRKDLLDWDHPIEVTGAFSYPAGLFEHLDEFKSALGRRFIMDPGPQTRKVAIDAGISKLGFTPGGYIIRIKPSGISVVGEEEEGLQFGLERLASLAFAKDGKLWMPSGSLIDQPRSDWRGVHLFVGPHSAAFQQRLWTKVLRPLGFNKVVLQCERTAWDSTPGIATPITMSKPDLIHLFEMYRSMGIEPIPLIESYGHMEWLFENGKNLDIAYNPKVPYAVDPEKPAAQSMLSRIWDEAISALHPDAVHFGLDEVDMRGFQENPPLETKLWEKQLEFLSAIAKSHGVKMMLWGDQALAPGDGPDASLGDDPSDAAARRAAIPKGSLIGDWHYLAEDDYTAYTKSLRIWKDAGLTPIATTWSDPANIHGFDVSAMQEGVGTLQTTWAGYESSEDTMLAALPQFTAMVLAADYSWSGRNEKPSDLGYDAAEVFRRLYFGQPSPVQPQPGVDLGAGAGAAFQIGQVRFGSKLTLEIASPLVKPTSDHSASSLALDVNVRGRELALALDTPIEGEDGESVCEVTLTFTDGSSVSKKVIYGWHVRAAADPAPLAIAVRDRGVCSVRIEFGGQRTLTGIAIKPLNAYSGLRIEGLEVFN